MKWKYETWAEKDERLQQWHRWFAWHPVWSEGTGYWLCHLERKAKWEWHYRVFEYREIGSEQPVVHGPKTQIDSFVDDVAINITKSMYGRHDDRQD